MEPIIKKVEVRPFRKYLFCPECDKNGVSSRLDYSCRVFMTNPPQYPHFCPICDYRTTENDKYPRIVYEEIGE